MQVAPVSASSQPVRIGLQIPVRLRRTLTQLTSQQFWLFGCDVRRPEGNVLTDLGFQKLKAPGVEPAPSRYHLVLATGETIVLWGFGLLWTDADGHGVFLPRHRFRPQRRVGCDAIPEVWQEADIANLHLPVHADCAHCGALLLDALDWLIAYERYVLGCRGVDYRAETIAAWSRPIGSGANLADCWYQVRTELAAGFARP